MARVEEELEKGWRENIASVLEERFSELADLVGREVERRVGERLAGEVQAAAAAREAEAKRKLGEQLNQAARRLWTAEGAEAVGAALLDSAAAFAAAAALFLVRGNSLRLLAAVRRGEAGPEPLGDIELPLSSAPAFRRVVDSVEPRVAVHGAGEISAAVAGALPAAPGSKVTLLPVALRGKVVAVLYVESGRDPADINVLELLTTLAAAALETKISEAGAGEGGRVSLAGDELEKAPALAAWNSLSEEDQELHLRARRFARVQVAEMTLYQSRAVAAGRSQKNLYSRLKDEIDAARQAYQTQFVKPCASMIDYFHLELVRTLANDDESLLGPEYPGPLV